MFFQENGQYRCAVYLRLSRSDGDQQESNSIKNQRALLNDYLGKHPEGLTATQLTELCKEDKAAISRTLSQLSSKGLVSCELPEHKRSYRTLYYLTEEGNTVVKKISSRIYSALAHGGDGMTEEQRLNLYDSLERISHNLEQYLTEISVKHPTEK